MINDFNQTDIDNDKQRWEKDKKIITNLGKI